MNFKDFNDPFLIYGVPKNVPDQRGKITELMRAHLNQFVMGGVRRKNEETHKRAEIILEFLINPEIKGYYTPDSDGWVYIRKIRHQLVYQKKPGRPEGGKDPLTISGSMHGTELQRVLDYLVKAEILECSPDFKHFRINSRIFTSSVTLKDENEMLWKQLHLREDLALEDGRIFFIMRNWLEELGQYSQNELSKRYQEKYGEEFGYGKYFKLV